MKFYKPDKLKLNSEAQKLIINRTRLDLPYSIGLITGYTLVEWK